MWSNAIQFWICDQCNVYIHSNRWIFFSISLIHAVAAKTAPEASIKFNSHRYITEALQSFSLLFLRLFNLSIFFFLPSSGFVRHLNFQCRLYIFLHFYQPSCEKSHQKLVSIGRFFGDSRIWIWFLLKSNAQRIHEKTINFIISFHG